MVYKNYAFISYSHNDRALAMQLQNELEKFDLPDGIANECLPGSSHLRPIFRDTTDLNAGVLIDQLKQNLEESKYLIVLCSYHSAKSEWVSRECEMFIEMGRFDAIIPVVVDGVPYSGGATECMPISLCELAKESPDNELLAIEYSGDKRTRTLVAIASRILNVPFDRLYNRHRRHKRNRRALWLAGALMSALVFAFFALPVRVTINIHDEQHFLPVDDNATLSINGISYNVRSHEVAIDNYHTRATYDTTLVARFLPANIRMKTINIVFSGMFYDTLRVQEKAGLLIGIGNTYDLYLRRDDSFSLFAGQVVSEDDQPIEGAVLKVAGMQTTTDAEGHFELRLPIDLQATEQSVLVIKDGYTEIHRDDECPSPDLYYIMYSN